MNREFYISTPVRQDTIIAKDADHAARRYAKQRGIADVHNADDLEYYLEERGEWLEILDAAPEWM